MAKKISKAEIADKEYNYAISLIQYHIQLLWSQFGIFLLVETIIIGFIGTAITSDEPNRFFVLVGSIFGFVICFPWWSTFIHNYQYYILRMAQARKHEKKLGIKLLSEGKQMSEGYPVEIDNKIYKHTMLAMILPPRRAIKFLIILFWLLFVVLIIFSITQMLMH